MSQPTPRPWTRAYFKTTETMVTNFPVGSVQTAICTDVSADTSEMLVALCGPDDEQSKVDAAHIVKCVNLHDELVEALRAHVAVLKEYGRCLHEYGTTGPLVSNFDHVDKLLAKAEAE